MQECNYPSFNKPILAYSYISGYITCIDTRF